MLETLLNIIFILMCLLDIIYTVFVIFIAVTIEPDLIPDFLERFRAYRAECARKIVRRFTAPQLRPITNDQKRYFWTVAAILTTILTICMAQLLFGCKSPKTGPSGPVAPPVDSTHLLLKKKVATAKDTAKAAHQRTSQTKQPYENAAANYTAVRDSLLNQ